VCVCVCVCVCMCVCMCVCSQVLHTSFTHQWRNRVHKVLFVQRFSFYGFVIDKYEVLITYKFFEVINIMLLHSIISHNFLC